MSSFDDRTLPWPEVLPLIDEVFEFFGEPKTQFKKSFGIDPDASERIWPAKDQLVFMVL
jgi:hypothetical protein